MFSKVQTLKWSRGRLRHHLIVLRNFAYEMVGCYRTLLDDGPRLAFEARPVPCPHVPFLSIYAGPTIYGQYMYTDDERPCRPHLITPFLW